MPKKKQPESRKQDDPNVMGLRAEVLDDFSTWDEEKYAFVKEVLWQENGKFVGLDHKIALGENGITLKDAKGL